MFVKMTKDQIKQKMEYIKAYAGALNAASGSEMDRNANLTTKNVATLTPDFFKDVYIQKYFLKKEDKK